MLRTIKISAVGMLAVGMSVAGLIPINLTTATTGIATCATASCNPAAGSYTFTSTGGYMNTTFSNVTLAGAPTPSNSPQTPAYPGGVPFELANNGSSNNAYYTPSAASNQNTSIVMYLGGYAGTSATATQGVFNVDDIYTMIQANNEAFGLQGITITLNGVASNGTTAISDQINLTAGVDYRGSNSGQLTCDDANYVSGGSCANATSDTAQVSGHETQTVAGVTSTVVTYNNAYGGNTGGLNYYMDVQELELPGLSNTGSFMGGYLDSVTITSIAAGGGKERMYFSGLTVDSPAPAPEPSTVVLFGAGLGLVGFFGIRKSKKTA